MTEWFVNKRRYRIPRTVTPFFCCFFLHHTMSKENNLNDPPPLAYYSSALPRIIMLRRNISARMLCGARLFTRVSRRSIIMWGVGLLRPLQSPLYHPPTARVSRTAIGVQRRQRVQPTRYRRRGPTAAGRTAVTIAIPVARRAVRLRLFVRHAFVFFFLYISFICSFPFFHFISLLNII